MFNRFLNHKLLIFIYLILCSLFLEGKPPELTPVTTKRKAEQILRAHVLEQELTIDIGKRIISNFIDELDPIKTYFTKDQIVKYVSPTDHSMQQFMNDYHLGKFSVFEEIYRIIDIAITRRHRLDAKVEKASLPEKAEATDFQDIDWAENEEELELRLQKLRTLQLETAEKLEWETEERFLQRLKKRQQERERKILQQNQSDRRKQMLAYFLKSLATALDNHTVYFTPSEANQFIIQVQQCLSGVGAQLRDDIDGLTVIRLLEGGPALASGKLCVGDRIIAVDSEPILGMEITEAVELIRGVKGTDVKLTVLRQLEGKKEEKKIEITITREEIALEETRLQSKFVPYGDGVIATLHLFSFYQNGADSSAADIRKEIENLQKEHKVLGVLLDLRGNAGGILPQAVEVSGLFIKKGIIVSVKDNQGRIRHLRNFNDTPIWDGPLVILTNKATASCGEIVAQALQDYQRAILVGDATTWGKGSYQSFTLESGKDGMKINPEGEYKVTRGLYYTVSGKSPQLTGALVDIEVPGLLSEIQIGEKEAKFPLNSDAIDPNFVDTLSDIHPFHRRKMKKYYSQNRQEKVKEYLRHLPTLNKNSSYRIAHNTNYQNFLQELKKETFDPSQMKSYGQNDLQWEEAVAILKDLIWLHKKGSSLAEEKRPA